MIVCGHTVRILRYIFQITNLRCISTSFFTDPGTPLFKKFCRASKTAGSTFGFAAPLDRTNSGANFTTAESIQQHITQNLKRNLILVSYYHTLGQVTTTANI
jgi:hypothetical protein